MIQEKVLKIIIIVGIIVVIGIAIFIILMMYSSPGKMDELKNSEGKSLENATSVKEKVQIGGLEQGMFIIGENVNNPVILFLHGGYTPEYPLYGDQILGNDIYKNFTVAYWDQRGTGMSKPTNFTDKSMTLDTLVNDTIEVSEYLKDKFKQEKIILIGHSWGSYLGVKTIEKKPELYQCYIALGVARHQEMSEKLAFEELLKRAENVKDNKTVKKLEKMNLDPSNFDSNGLSQLREKSYAQYKMGTLYKMESSKLFNNNVAQFKGYTIREKFNVMNGMSVFLPLFQREIEGDDLAVSSTKFDIPVYFIQGLHDFTTSYDLAKEYFKLIEAPSKEFYTFENSAHMPSYEEPEKFKEILLGIQKNLDSI